MDFETIAAYLAGECTEAEKQAVEHWRKENAVNEREFQQWNLIWQASQATNEHFKPDASGAWQKIKPAKERPLPLKTQPLRPGARKPQVFIRLRNLAAILLMVSGLGWIIWQWDRTEQAKATAWTEQTAVDGKPNEIVLTDGSRIWLNTNSKLRFPRQFHGASREVFLEGEAYFEVAHQPQKPFLVHTPESVTEVLGTSFNVRSYRHEPFVEINLLSGKVSFGLPGATPDGKKLLKPGQKAVLDKNTQVITVTGNDNENYLAWKTNKLVFRETALREALQTLETYYQVEFTVSDTLLLNCRFTATFDKAPLDDVLEIFAFGSDISYHKQGSRYYLSGAGCP
jgi:transmembrane sensor